MSSGKFDLSGGHPALDLINTLDNRFAANGPVELLNDYSDLLRFMRQANLMSARQTKLLEAITRTAANRALLSARELREALASAFYGLVEGTTPPQSALYTIQQHFLNASRMQLLVWTKPKFEWVWTERDTAPELPLWMLATAAVELMTSDAMERVRTCDSDTCRWLFLDTSKNHTRRWCNMKVCGNRMKARRFQARRQE
jgi:predicted RNA-binding Zn ribbon-like protein